MCSLLVFVGSKGHCSALDLQLSLRTKCCQCSSCLSPPWHSGGVTDHHGAQRWTSKALWPTSKTMLIWAQPLKGLLLLLSYEGIPKRLEGAIANCRTLSKTNNGARVIVAAPNFLINGRKTNAVYLKQAFSCLDSITTSLFIQIRPLPGKQGIDSVSVAKILQRQA